MIFAQYFIFLSSRRILFSLCCSRWRSSWPHKRKVARVVHNRANTTESPGHNRVSKILEKKNNITVFVRVLYNFDLTLRSPIFILFYSFLFRVFFSYACLFYFYPPILLYYMRTHKYFAGIERTSYYYINIHVL